MKAFRLLIIIALVLAACVVISRAAYAITWHEFITPVKRGFYGAVFVAIFFYFARLMRAWALYWEAKADKEAGEL